MLEIKFDEFYFNEYFVKVPAGEIALRDDRIKQKWTTNVQTFWLAKYPVTQNFYNKITCENPSVFTGGSRPVDSVSWKDAVTFCNKLSEQAGLLPCYDFRSDDDKIFFDTKANGFRLPTEAEWQFACQAGSKEIRYGVLDDIAWYKGNAHGSTQEVGLKQPNSLGLHDMLGNIWEWCSDVYDETVYGTYRIFRGGGWCDDERSVMATTRRRSHPVSFKIDDLGFRIAKNLVE